MKALVVSSNESLTTGLVFSEVDIPQPEPGERDLLVQVEAISVNPIDTKIRQTTNPEAEPNKILGWDAAGTVQAVGSKVKNFKPGDKVFYAGAINRPGSNAEFQLVDERIVGHPPKNTDMLSAASMPLTALTAWEALFDRMEIQPEKDSVKTILIIGGAGGVGSVAIQLAKKIAKLNVIATASRKESRDWCNIMGADYILDHSQNLSEQFNAQNLPQPNYIFCLNDTDFYFSSMAELIAPQGKICAIVSTAQNHDLNLLKTKSVSFVWEFMFTRSMFQTDDMQKQGEILKQISGLLDKGILKTTLTENLGKLTSENLQFAHEKIESGHTIGKIVLTGF